MAISPRFAIRRRGRTAGGEGNGGADRGEASTRSDIWVSDWSDPNGGAAIRRQCVHSGRDTGGDDDDERNHRKKETSSSAGRGDERQTG